MKIFYIATLVTAILVPSFLRAQTKKPLKDNWQNLDMQTDSVFGISTEKTYNELLKGKKHVPVIVAIIDVGVDINHEELKSIIWANKNEIAGNQKDDDKNGYADDIHGWNFIGGPGGDIEYETNEVIRLIRKQKPLYENADSTKLNPGDLVNFRRFKKMENDVDSITKKTKSDVDLIDQYFRYTDTLMADMHNQNPSNADFQNYIPKQDKNEHWVRYMRKHYFGNDFKAYIKLKKDSTLIDARIYLDYNYNINYNPRYMVGDDPDNPNEHIYGNNHVSAPNDEHGTFVSGIIAALRNNNIGIKGVANDVIIMPVRAIPQGDERDKDVANAIRYAVDNGAKIINMSFYKLYSPNKAIVDKAVKYAVSKDVLLVHCAGNDGVDVDVKPAYPTKTYADGSGEAATWLEVGASGAVNDTTLKADFSNWGHRVVDVFAPGLDIRSCIAGSKYDVQSGTSYSSPMVAGLGALIRSYYPKLSAVLVRDIIIKSVTKVYHDVIVSDDPLKKLPFSTLCASGGIVNAYNALKLAATY